MTTLQDEQFKDFAENVFDSLPWDDVNMDMEKEGWEDRAKLKIAQKAYQLVQHTLDNATGIYDKDVIYDVSAIPDFTPSEED